MIYSMPITLAQHLRLADHLKNEKLVQVAQKACLTGLHLVQSTPDSAGLHPRSDRRVPLPRTPRRLICPVANVARCARRRRISIYTIEDIWKLVIRPPFALVPYLVYDRLSFREFLIDTMAVT